MTRIPRELRKQRCIMTTDSEWEAITGRAKRAGMTNSRFIVRAYARCAGEQPNGRSRNHLLSCRPVSSSVMAVAMLVLARIEEQRLRDTGAAALWDRLVEEETEYPRFGGPPVKGPAK